jgi:hypothetical protein
MNKEVVRVPPRSLSVRLERRLAEWYRRMTPPFIEERGPGWISYRGSRTVYLRRGPHDAPQRGIYLRGACDVPSLFMLAPLVIGGLEGSLCIRQSGNGVSDARSDLLLQSHAGVPDDFVQEMRERFSLANEYFEPALFRPTFDVPDLPVEGPYPKTIVALSILPDLSRTVYRHRERGFRVDPGAAWLNEMARFRDLSFVEWFKKTFEPLGRIDVEEFRANYRTLIPLLRRETGAHILVLNSLEIDPFDATYDYSVRNLQSASRRRRFNLALAELAEGLDFHIIDVDRILKEEGVEGQVDFSHFPVERMRAVAFEAANILRGIGVL